MASTAWALQAGRRVPVRRRPAADGPAAGHMSSYVTETPTTGQFPRWRWPSNQGHVEEGPLAAARRLKIGDAFQGIDAWARTSPAAATTRRNCGAAWQRPRRSGHRRVTVKIADGQKRSKAVRWSDYWDQEKKIVRSMTGPAHLTTAAGSWPSTRPRPGHRGLRGGGSTRCRGCAVQVRPPS